MTTGNDDHQLGDRDTPVRPVPSLPVELNSFIGRSRLLEHSRKLLRSADTRLMTLTGLGGVGKTRLLLRIADELAEGHGYRDGVVVAKLVDLHDDTDRLYGAIADA